MKYTLVTPGIDFIGLKSNDDLVVICDLDYSEIQGKLIQLVDKEDAKDILHFTSLLSEIGSSHTHTCDRRTIHIYRSL